MTAQGLPGRAPPRGVALVPLFLATTAVVALNAVYFKRMMNCYRSDPSAEEPHDYALFVSVFGILLWALLMSAVAQLGGWSAVRFPRRGLMRTACADQLCTLLATNGATQVSGQALVLLNQSVLPLTMVMSLALGRRYRPFQVLGATVVLAGATLAVGISPQWALRGVLIICMAQAAAAAAGLMKEALLQDASWGMEQPIGDPIVLGVALAWARVPLGVVMALLARRGATLEEFRDGWRCFCGDSPQPGDEGCAAAFSMTLLSVAFYAAQTLLGLRLTQCGSATLKSIAVVTALPLAQLLFTSEVLMTGLGAEAYGHGSWLGMVLCLGGFSIYLHGQRGRGQRASKLAES